MLNNNIVCPNCGHQFPMEHSIREEIQKEYRAKWIDAQKKKEEEYAQKDNQLQLQQQQLQQNLLQQEEIVQKRLHTEKQKMEQQLATQLQQQIRGDFENQLFLLQKSNTANEERLKEARQKELAFLQQEQVLKTREQELEIEVQQKLVQARTQLLEQLKKEELDRLALKETTYTLKIKELEKQLADQKHLAEEMKRRVEQGSTQLQGEVQELALEALLRASFPFDIIEEVGKGVKGADCVHAIRNNVGQVCGKIIYESKRTKDFAKDWIEKLKADMRSVHADIAIIVTQAMPKDMDNFGEKEGIWICTFDDVKSLAAVLRASVIKLYTQIKAHENKGDKMHLMYNYLTSSNFAEQWSAIREGFHAMKISIQKEREAMERLWKASEKQLEKVLLSAAHMKGSIEGIAGTEAIDLNLLDDAGSHIIPLHTQ